MSGCPIGILFKQSAPEGGRFAGIAAGLGGSSIAATPPFYPLHHCRPRFALSFSAHSGRSRPVMQQRQE